MRVSVVLAAPILFAAFAPVGAQTQSQCSPAVTKLVNDQKFDEARAEPQAALKKNPSDDAALRCMGYIAIGEGKPGDAIPWLEKAVKANDKSSLNHLWLGNALGDNASHVNKLKLPFLARRVKGEFDRAAELDPTSVDAKHGQIQFYSQAPGVMGGDMNHAKELAREIGKLNPMRGHLEMAVLLERDKDVAGAEKELVAAVAASPDSNAAYNNMGNFYRRQKKYDEAAATYERLLKVKPDAVTAHLNIAWNLALSGQNLDRAEREARFWLSAPPKDVSQGTLSFAHYLLGDIYQRRTKTNEARAEYQLALQINPKNSDAKKALDALK